MIKQFSIAIMVVTLFTGCGGSDNNNDSNNSSARTSSSTAASSLASSADAISSEASSAASSMTSSSESSSSEPSADLSFGFETGIEGWYINGQAAGTTVTSELELAHDMVNSALEITPLDWAVNAGSNWMYQARLDFANETDLSNAHIEFVVSIPESYITDATLELQLIINHATSTSYGATILTSTLTANDEGDYVVGRDINVTSAQGIAFQLAKAPTDTSIKEPILVKSVLIDRPEGSSGSSSSAASSTSSAPTNQIIYSFASDTEGWRNDYGTTSEVVHNAEAAAAEIISDWTPNNQNVIKEITSTDLTGASIEYVFTVTQAQVDGGLQVQPYIQTGDPSYVRLYGPIVTPVAGENTLMFLPQVDDANNIQIIQRIAFQLNGPITAGTTDRVQLNQVTLTLEP